MARARATVILAALALFAIAATARADDEIASPPPPSTHLALSASAVAGVYAVFGTYAYFAWFRNANEKPFSVISDWRSENPFGIHSYAGGADKFGHAWFNYILVRGTTEILAAGGWGRVGASLVSAALAETAFTISEIKDGFIWGFEVGDAAANLAGAALAVLFESSPTIDRLFDFRLAYFPSSDYRYLVRSMPFFQRGNGVDFTQDYSGQSYLLALHLSGLPRVKDEPWARFVDVVGGFETRGFEPVRQDTSIAPRQIFYAGLSINLQGVLEALLPDSLGRRIGHGAFEVLGVPGTTLRYGEAMRSP